MSYARLCAQRTATPPFPLCLPDGNSNVIEISARAKSHLQSERESEIEWERESESECSGISCSSSCQPSVSAVPRPHTSPALCLSLHCWKPQHCCFYYYIFFPIFFPDFLSRFLPLSPSAFPVSVVVTFWQISEINVCIYSCMHACVWECMCIASILPIFPERGSQLVTLCLCHMGTTAALSNLPGTAYGNVG